MTLPVDEQIWTSGFATSMSVPQTVQQCFTRHGPTHTRAERTCVKAPLSISPRTRWRTVASSSSGSAPPLKGEWGRSSTARDEVRSQRLRSTELRTRLTAATARSQGRQLWSGALRW
jgi:hypothetical protein